jgi:outer membrane receptor for ferrienterochelin and colicin
VKVIVPLGGAAEQNFALQAAAAAENVEVTATAPPLANPTVGLNIRHDEVEALATSRTLQGIATLSPAVNENTPNTGQLSINGAFGFDNLFMVNGVDVDDNLFGTPQNLFIEDAIEETQVITSGISAEYGRFSGGVVNAITRSGGNIFSGSFRVNFTNPSWTDETPFEKENDIERQNKLNESYELTLGGPIVQDRLWFFGAGRRANITTSNTFDVTAVPYQLKDDAWRVEGKLTGTITPGHTATFGFLNNSRKLTDTPAFQSLSIDPATLTTQKYPNWYAFANYRGAIRSNFLAEGQFSERRFKFDGAGGTNTNIVESPFFTLTQDEGQYNAPYFDATDPEQRNNRQFTGSVTYFVNRGGSHEFKAGYEWFRSQNIGGNSQSATGYVFDADYLVDANGDPVLDAQGRLQPAFVPVDPSDEDVAPTRLENWIPVRGATLNVDNNSIYAQDHWAINRHFSADLGFRYERVRSEATGNIVGVDTDTIVPRLALSYDARGDGRYVFHTTYGHYSGRYNEAQIGVNSNVGNPDETIAQYIGPAGVGRNFAPGFDPANYEIVEGTFPTSNVSFEEGLSSPITREFTVSGGVSSGRAYGEATYLWRDTVHLIEDFIEATNDSTEVIRGGVNFGEFTNRVYRNSDIPERHYQAAVFEGRYRLQNRWTVYGAWTIQLKNEGNYAGEATNQPGSPSIIGDYPEAFTAARNYPIGRLGTFQHHRARIWSIYDFDLGHAGDLSVSGLLRLESGQAYSLVATGQALTSIQESLLDKAGYVDRPNSQSVYFGERGSETFPGYALFDVSANYAIPVFKSLRPWLKVDIFNLFNNDKLVAFNTTVRPDPTSPADALGLRTGFIKGSSFGEARGAGDYPKSLGTSGGRTFRMAFGFRF